MIYVMTKGHDYKHDLFELVRVFLPKEKIIFVNDKSNLQAKAYLLETEVIGSSEIFIFIRVFKDGELILKDCENIDIYTPSDYYINTPIKQAVKRGVYRILNKLTKKLPPWGILTGIRPVKINHDLYEKGIDDNDIYSILLEKYMLSSQKASLVKSIAKLQRKHIYPLDSDRYSLYVGIPFCPSKCTYCSFPSFTINNASNVDNYIKSLLYELRMIARMMKGKKLNTVYIGGGTPTALKTKDLELIIKLIREIFPKNIKEFTVEAGRPDTIDSEILSMLKDYKIDRISINPQTMNNETLDLVGRKHNSQSINKAYNLAKSLGFDIINMDIILGLPGENIEDLRNTLGQIKKLDPNNLTLHTLSIKRGSRIHKDRDAYMDKGLEIEDMLEEVFVYGKEMGLEPYYLYRQKQILGNLENIGFSKKNKESIYNIAMMEEKETIIAAGLGGVSKIFYPNENRIERIPNFKSLRDYVERIDELILRKQKYI